MRDGWRGWRRKGGGGVYGRGRGQCRGGQGRPSSSRRTQRPAGGHRLSTTIQEGPEPSNSKSMHLVYPSYFNSTRLHTWKDTSSTSRDSFKSSQVPSPSLSPPLSPWTRTSIGYDASRVDVHAPGSWTSCSSSLQATTHPSSCEPGASDEVALSPISISYASTNSYARLLVYRRSTSPAPSIKSMMKAMKCGATVLPSFLLLSSFAVPKSALAYPITRSRLVHALSDS